MSEHSFGYYDGDQDRGEGDQFTPQPESGGIKALRQKAEADSKALKEMKDQLAVLQAENQQAKVAEKLRQAGYDPGAAAFYQGEPTGVDDWLKTHGSLLAKPSGAPEQGAGQEGTEQPQGPPATSVTPEGQEQMQRMQEAGTQGVAAPQGSDKELAAAIAACQNEEEFAKLMKSHGSTYDWS